MPESFYIQPDCGDDTEYASDLHYDMFVVSVPNLLEMEEMLPHQVLLQKNLLESWKPSMRVIFISHEWLGYRHADPKGDQFKVLKRLLTRLMKGEIKQIYPHWYQSLALRATKSIDTAEMIAMLPNTYVWLDYFSVPQPACATVLPSGGIMAALGNRQLKEFHKQQDRLIDAYQTEHDFQRGHISNALNMAVASIPGYIERSWMLLVLVPVCEHVDKETICNYASWRSRGWCRLEFLAAILSSRPVRVVICAGAESQPYFSMGFDAIFLPPGCGIFTCCHLGHMVDGKPIQCDKHKVEHVLDQMIETKIAYYKKFRMRSQELTLFSIRHCFHRGLPEGGNYLGRESVGRAISSSLEQFMITLQWEDADDADVASTGHSPLFFAVLSNNITAIPGAVEDLARRQISIDMRTQDVQLFLGQTSGRTTLLMHAMVFASFEAVSMLLDARADPHLSSTSKLAVDALAMGLLYSRSDNVQQWLVRFPSWDVNQRRGAFGATYLHFAAMGPSMDNHQNECASACIRALIKAAADPNTRADMGTTAMMNVALKDDSDAESILALVENGADVNMRMFPRTSRLRAVFWLMRIFRMFGRRGLPEVLAEFPGMTAAHPAAERGDVDVVQALLLANADVHLRNFRKHSPLHNAAAKFGGVIPHSLEKVLLNLDKTSSVELATTEAPVAQTASILGKSMEAQGTETQNLLQVPAVGPLSSEASEASSDGAKRKSKSKFKQQGSSKSHESTGDRARPKSKNKSKRQNSATGRITKKELAVTGVSTENDFTNKESGVATSSTSVVAVSSTNGDDAEMSPGTSGKP